MHIRYTIIVFVTFCLALSVGSAVVAGNKGEQWDYTLAIEIEGKQMPLPPSKVCVRPEDGDTPPVEKHCQVSERTVSGNTTTFRIVCGSPEPGELKGQFTRKGDHVEGRYAMTQDGEVLTVVASGHRLGTCDPDKPALPTAKP